MPPCPVPPYSESSVRAAAPSAPLPATTLLAPLAHALDALLSRGADTIADTIAASLGDSEAILAALPPDALLGDPGGYTRHLLYADPLGRFSAMALVWRPGQHSPVHGHRAWCAYRVLRGTLSERHYAWEPALQSARFTGTVERHPDDTFTVPAGLRHIHSLGNAGDDIAVSLHIYGVNHDHIATGVNLPVAFTQ